MRKVERKIDLYSDNIGFVEYVSHMGSDVTVVNSARVSFGKHVSDLSDADKRLISYLIKHRHTSTLEHCVVTLRFKVPLFIRSQHHRHRTWSYNEISRRYTEFNLELLTTPSVLLSCLNSIMTLRFMFIISYWS